MVNGAIITVVVVVPMLAVIAIVGGVIATRSGSPTSGTIVRVNGYTAPAQQQHQQRQQHQNVGGLTMRNLLLTPLKSLPPAGSGVGSRGSSDNSKTDHVGDRSTNSGAGAKSNNSGAGAKSTSSGVGAKSTNSLGSSSSGASGAGASAKSTTPGAGAGAKSTNSLGSSSSGASGAGASAKSTTPGAGAGAKSTNSLGSSSSGASGPVTDAVRKDIPPIVMQVQDDNKFKAAVESSYKVLNSRLTAFKYDASGVARPDAMPLNDITKTCIIRGGTSDEADVVVHVDMFNALRCEAYPINDVATIDGGNDKLTSVGTGLACVYQTGDTVSEEVHDRMPDRTKKLQPEAPTSLSYFPITQVSILLQPPSLPLWLNHTFMPFLGVLWEIRFHLSRADVRQRLVPGDKYDQGYLEASALAFGVMIDDWPAEALTDLTEQDDVLNWWTVRLCVERQSTKGCVRDETLYGRVKDTVISTTDAGDGDTVNDLLNDCFPVAVDMLVLDHIRCALITLDTRLREVCGLKQMPIKPILNVLHEPIAYFRLFMLPALRSLSEVQGGTQQ